MMHLHLARHLKSYLLVLCFKMGLFACEVLVAPRNLVLHSCCCCTSAGQGQMQCSNKEVEWSHKMKGDGFSVLVCSFWCVGFCVCLIPLQCCFLTLEAV